MKKILILFFLIAFLTSGAFAQSVGSPIKGKLSNNSFDYIRLDNDFNLKVISTGCVDVDMSDVSNEISSLSVKIETENSKVLNTISTSSTNIESKIETENAKLLTTIATSSSDYASIETTSVSVTDTSADITALTDRSWITLQNTGANTVYVNIGGTPATTSGNKLVANGSIGIQKIADSVTVSVICDSGESSTVIVVQGAK